MESKAQQPVTWYSSIGGKQEEGLGFYETSDFSWVSELESNWQVVRKEVEAFMTNNEERIKPYFNKKLVSGPKKWKAFSFRFWSWGVTDNAKECPETMRIMSKIPGLVSASISILEPHTDIHPHKGDTNAIYRCHLGLSIPAPLPECGFQVGDVKKSWKEGEVLAFNDAAEHQAWNHTDSIRFVLLFDVIRPEFIHKKYRVCAFVLAGLVMQLFAQKSVLIRKLPWTMKKGMLRMISVVVWMVLRIKNI